MRNSAWVDVSNFNYEEEKIERQMENMEFNSATERKEYEKKLREEMKK